MTRVLVVDDEPQLARLLVINLKARKYDVDCARDGAAALDAVAARSPDVVLLDLGLPDTDGIDVIRHLRGWSQVPVVVVSARHGSEAKILALDAGADDYVTKPFSMDELLARLKAVARRTARQPRRTWSSRPPSSPWICSRGRPGAEGRTSGSRRRNGICSRS